MRVGEIYEYRGKNPEHFYKFMEVVERSGDGWRVRYFGDIDEEDYYVVVIKNQGYKLSDCSRVKQLIKDYDEV